MRFITSAKFLFAFLFLGSFSPAMAQDYAEKIKGKWNFEKAEVVRQGRDQASVNLMMAQFVFNFDGTELQVSKKTPSGDSLLKKMPYRIQDDLIYLDKDFAKILTLNQGKLVYKTSEAIFYYRRL